MGAAAADPIPEGGDDQFAARLARRVADFANEYPWQWQCADVEAFIDSCRNRAEPIVVSTARLYETTLRMFLQYVSDPRYGWTRECLPRFGVAPTQVLHEWNTVVHVSEYEGDPRRRPFTYDEVQALFDAADGLVDGHPRPPLQGRVGGDAGRGTVENVLRVWTSAPRSLGIGPG